MKEDVERINDTTSRIIQILEEEKDDSVRMTIVTRVVIEHSLRAMDFMPKEATPYDVIETIANLAAKHVTMGIFRVLADGLGDDKSPDEE